MNKTEATEKAYWLAKATGLGWVGHTDSGYYHEEGSWSYSAKKGCGQIFPIKTGGYTLFFYMTPMVTSHGPTPAECLANALNDVRGTIEHLKKILEEQKS